MYHNGNGNHSRVNTMGKQLITKANKLTSASYSLGVTEQRLIFLAIIEARAKKKLIDAKGVLRIKAKAYQEQFSVEKHTAYEALKSATEGLFDAYFEYDDIDEATGKAAHHVVRWVQKITYIDDAGIVELQFTDAVIPLITRLSEQYTEYELKQVSELQSEYAIRLYEIMMRWKSVGVTHLIPLEDLRKQLGIKPEQYQAMNNFKLRVLNHGIKQINESTDITAEYEQHKTGRKVTGFTFRFKPKTKAVKQLQLTPKQIEAYSSKLARLPELGSGSPSGATYDQYAQMIAADLKTSEGVQKYLPHLTKLGFKQ